jgi:hypothetical protein
MMLWQTSNTTRRFPLRGEDAMTVQAHGIVEWSASKRDSGRWRG